MRILVVDTDSDLVEMLTIQLKTLGYEVYCEYTGEQAKIEWEKQQPDLIILDTNLRDIDALSICRDMQGKHDALVLVTTDSQDREQIQMYLELGVDDYLRKPYSPEELLAHMNTLAQRERPTLAQRPSSIITVGPIRFDALSREVRVDGKTSFLTPLESAFLRLLAAHANTVCSVSQISSHICGSGNDDGSTGLIKAVIRHIRQKIEPDPSNPTYILTVPGVGYKLVVNPD